MKSIRVLLTSSCQGPESNNPEVACQSNTDGDITTGGGFSASYRMPSWQKTAVQQYLNSTVGLSAVSGYEIERKHRQFFDQIPLR